MDKFYKETLSKLELEISELEVETDCSIERIEAVIQLITFYVTMQILRVNFFYLFCKIWLIFLF